MIVMLPISSKRMIVSSVMNGEGPAFHRWTGFDPVRCAREIIPESGWYWGIFQSITIPNRFFPVQAIPGIGHPSAGRVPFSAVPILPYPVIRQRCEDVLFDPEHYRFFAKPCQKERLLSNPGIMRGYLHASPLDNRVNFFTKRRSSDPIG